MILLQLVLLSVVVPSFSKPTPYALPGSKSRLVRRDADVPDPQICGEIISAVFEGATSFYASDAYACLISVPFNPAVALRFLQYYNTTIQFQSTLAYLKDPPPGYQQPAVDVLGTINAIESNITSGVYQNQYAFEQDLELLAYAMHDGHVDIQAGILQVFTYYSPYYISSVSVDGKAAPQVYFTDDIILVDQNQMNASDLSPIVQINGIDTIEYLTQFAALQAVGTVEPHADWNQLMANPALDIQGYPNIFGGDTTFYPGDELNFTLADGTSIDTYWLAAYNGPQYTGPLTTSGDFYNFFVLGLEPASYDQSIESSIEAGLDPATATDSTPTTTDPLASPTDPAATTTDSPLKSTNPTPTATAGGSVAKAIMQGFGMKDPSETEQLNSWYADSFQAYPDNPDIAQDDLSITGGGILTGYFLDDISTGILSIPSFQQYGDNQVTFTPKVTDFINGATERKMNHIIIDLQQNTGGDVSLALDTFKQIFPKVDICGGSRRRIHPLENHLGETLTAWWDGLHSNNGNESYWHYLYAADEWVVTNRINAATGNTFRSWEEYNTPQHHHDDDFSMTERYNLSDSAFNSAAFDYYYPYGYDPEVSVSQSPPWQPDQIVLLTDGLCSSACSLFLEMMTTQAGVKTIVMGGSPTGPAKMQAASGNRGAIFYGAQDLDSDIELASAVNNATTTLFPNRDDSGMLFYFIGINLRDQIRENGIDPLQFQYLAADCRLYYTVANLYNMTRLWRDVAHANWDDRSLCIPGSEGNSTMATETPLPSHAPISPPVVNWPTTQQAPNNTDAGDGGMQDGLDFGIVLTECGNNIICSTRSESCVKIMVRCGSQLAQPKSACVPSCSTKKDAPINCGSRLTCVSSKSNSQSVKVQGIRDTSQRFLRKGTAALQVFKGVCLPPSNRPYAADDGEFGCNLFDDSD